MAESKKSSGKKIVDVAHPGKSAPSASSKPVIVTNRPILKDPMVVEVSDGSEAPTSPAPSATRINVKPLDDSAPEPATVPEVENKKPAKSEKTAKSKTIAELAAEANARAADAKDEKDEKKEDPKPEPKAEPEPNPEPKPDPEPKAEDAKEPKVADTPTQEAADKKAQVDADEEKTKHEAELQKLVESKKYFLSINSVEKRRTKRVIVFGIILSLLLAVAWVDIALDAGLIQVDGVEPVTHMFSN